MRKVHVIAEAKDANVVDVIDGERAGQRQHYALAVECRQRRARSSGIWHANRLAIRLPIGADSDDKVGGRANAVVGEIADENVLFGEQCDRVTANAVATQRRQTANFDALWHWLEDVLVDEQVGEDHVVGLAPYGDDAYVANASAARQGEHDALVVVAP